MCKVIIKNLKKHRKSVLRTEDTYYEKISIKAIGTQLGIKQSINSFFSYCMEKGIGDPLIYMKKSEENCFDLLQPLSKVILHYIMLHLLLMNTSFLLIGIL